MSTKASPASRRAMASWRWWCVSLGFLPINPARLRALTALAGATADKFALGEIPLPWQTGFYSRPLGLIGQAGDIDGAIGFEAPSSRDAALMPPSFRPAPLRVADVFDFCATCSEISACLAAVNSIHLAICSTRCDAAAASSHRAPVFTFRPSSTSRRIASGRVSGSACFAIQASSASNCSGSRRTITPSRRPPVGGRPRPFFGISLIEVRHPIVRAASPDACVSPLCRRSGRPSS